MQTRTVHDPFHGKDVQISDRLVDRLRGKYASGPHLPNGNPEFGWRQFQAPPIQHDAAARIEELEATLREVVSLHGGTMVTFQTEQVINGIRFSAGDYVLIRTGPAQDEPKF